MKEVYTDQKISIRLRDMMVNSSDQSSRATFVMVTIRPVTYGYDHTNIFARSTIWNYFAGISQSVSLDIHTFTLTFAQLDFSFKTYLMKSSPLSHKSGAKG